MLIPRQAPETDTLQWLASKETGAPLQDLRFGRLRLTRPFEFVAPEAAETALMFLSGVADVTVGIDIARTMTWHNVGRGAHTPFGRGGDLLLVDSGALVRIQPPHGYAVDVAVISAAMNEDTHDKTLPTLIRAQDALTVQMHADSGHYAREVRTYLGDHGPASRIRCGETCNITGHWSSQPLHGFEHLDVQGFEEIFFYAVQNANGEGIQRMKGPYVTGEQVDSVAIVHTGDVCVIPCGMHPATALPDGRLWYIWAYISNDSRVTKAPPKFMEDRLHA